MSQAASIGSLSTRHYGRLDSLRGLAVLGVLAAHRTFNHLIPYGIWGVQLLFVLSGFLITSILLQARDDAEGSGGPRGRVLLGHPPTDGLDPSGLSLP